MPKIPLSKIAVKFISKKARYQMSYHPYRRNSRLWTIYWNEPAPAQTQATPEIALFELTEPYCLNRDEWREVQNWLLLNLTPPTCTLNISQLWGRNWPSDASFRFNRINDSHKLPNLLSSDCYQQTQPGKREGYYWVMAQTKPNREVLDDLLWYQGIDFENITWITKEPIAPFPTQLFEFNKVAMGWHNKDVSNAELNEVVKQECWGLSITTLGHLNLRVPTTSLSSSLVWQVIREAAANFDLEIESSGFDKRPRKPSLVRGLATAPANLVLDGLGKLNKGFKR